MAKADYYDTLGVDRGADDKALKAAFRKLAMQYHPDRNPGDETAEQRFKDINEAYETLKDPQKRAAYDRFGHDAFNGGMGGPGGFNGDFAGSMADIFDDLFGEFMGGRQAGGRRTQRSRGSDLRYNMEITLEEAHAGKAAEIRIPSSAPCDACEGSGAEPGTGTATCPMCDGAGRVRASQGFFAIERTCPTCQGRGEIIESPCAVCSGAGRVTRERTLSINIPAGVEDGTRIRLAGEGEAGMRGGTPGDLYIFLAIKPHEIFQRDGADLFCRMPIPMTVAALGGEIDVPTLEGTRAKVKVPAGTQSGKQIRLRGKGMPVLRQQQAGDLYIQTMVETPTNLTRRQRELLEEFAGTANAETNPESASFLSRVKDFFGGS